MSFHVYVEPELEQQLTYLCKKTGLKRNAIVREALRDYVAKHASKDWPQSVFDFKPDPNIERFEHLRRELPQDRDSIFGSPSK